MPKLAQLESEWQKSNPSKPQSAARQAWMTQRGGVEKLAPEHLDSAKRSYENWDPKHKARHSFENYVVYVQKRDEERQPGQGRPGPRRNIIFRTPPMRRFDALARPCRKISKAPRRKSGRPGITATTPRPSPPRCRTTGFISPLSRSRRRSAAISIPASRERWRD